MYLPGPVGLWSNFPSASSEGSGDGVLGGAGGAGGVDGAGGVLEGPGLKVGDGRGRTGC